MSELYYGDAFDVLSEKISDESVDLVYLDPQTRFNQAHNISPEDRGRDYIDRSSDSLLGELMPEADSKAVYRASLVDNAPEPLKTSIETIRVIAGEGPTFSYIASNAGIFPELYRTLKPAGFLVLQCNPAVSHYFRLTLDAVFGQTNFRNEIVWKYLKRRPSQTLHVPRNHDAILVYGKTDKAIWNRDALFAARDINDSSFEYKHKGYRRDEEGRLYRHVSLVNPNPNRENYSYEFLGVTRVWRWAKERMESAYNSGLIEQRAPGSVPVLKQYIDESRGEAIDEIWTDIPGASYKEAQRLGYPTQKPAELLARIISMTTLPGGMVLDPYAGEGITVDVAQDLSRRWIGINKTTQGIALIDTRLRHKYGEEARDHYNIVGLPHDLNSARALLANSPAEFERWCLMQVDGQFHDSRHGDRGFDGIIRIPLDHNGVSQRILVSVKAGRIKKTHIVELERAVRKHRAAMGIIITMDEPDLSALDAMTNSGVFNHPGTGVTYPKIQIIKVEQLLQNQRPEMPTPLLPYFQEIPRSRGSDS
ncbi:site-specific DNA-methyltransferase [Streptosporangium sandarakinum]|uniref:Site-specific DNA-methyltransferase (Adenine-specific) n=1 Tax=Streptosporangium sandarakinum TaxID=1260955 RepID=A0A852UZJ2_9ACTN|nr:DNA methyltransferase [Streptosporangium sandarakinum]NYF42922.1 site-specific DNA-methyltransferase (adenine-specific) [Streptosporangium sandarakinum]